MERATRREIPAAEFLLNPPNPAAVLGGGGGLDKYAKNFYSCRVPRRALTLPLPTKSALFIVIIIPQWLTLTNQTQ